MTFVDHLSELRSRLIKSAIAVVIGMAVSAWYIDDIVAFVTSPAGTLYVMRPAEAFLIYMKFALWSGAVLASPILFYQFWAFLLPAFTTHEKKDTLLVRTGIGPLISGRTGFFLCRRPAAEPAFPHDLYDR